MTVKRAAIYARFSTDLQSERSIDDQVALCRDFAVRSGFQVAAVFQDRAKSGASVLGRDGLLALMAAAKARAFDVLLVEHSDRIARSMRDLADIHERLTFQGIEIRAVHSGAAMDTATIGLFGLVGQMQREDGAKKVRRGMAGVVRDGRHAGGRAYGYRAVPGEPGRLSIDPTEATIVRRIFAAYIGGESPRTIAAALNAERVAPPRGRLWNASTINGNLQRGAGILQNALYGGRIVWNKVRMVKDPETGRRISRPNPAAEHQAVDAPELAIVDAETLQAAALRKGARKVVARTPTRPRRLLSGLLKCGACGSGLTAYVKDRSGRTRLRCSAVSESGSCDHTRTYYADAIEAATIDGLRRELRNPAAIAIYVKEYHAERKRLAGDLAGRRMRLTTRRGELTRELERMVDAIAQGLATAATVGARILSAEAERNDIDAELGTIAAGSDVVAIHPAAVQRYLGQIEELSTVLASGGDLSASSPAGVVRSLIESVVVHPTVGRNKLDVEIRGYLARLTQDPGHPPHKRLYWGVMVAEEGLEPPTRGL